MRSTTRNFTIGMAILVAALVIASCANDSSIAPPDPGHEPQRKEARYTEQQLGRFADVVSSDLSRLGPRLRLSGVTVSLEKNAVEVRAVKSTPALRRELRRRYPRIPLIVVEMDRSQLLDPD